MGWCRLPLSGRGGGLRGRCRLRLASWDLIGAVGDTSPVSNKGIGFY